jgi:hypothetical protein
MTPGPFGPPPSQYMSRYKQCLVSLANGTLASVCIDGYLSASDRSARRVRDGDKAYNDLVEALSARTGTARYSSSYSLDGRRVHLDNFKMPFVGKGSPFDVRQAVLAASWCGMVDVSTLQLYCSKNMGLDCNGFASNLFCLDRNTSVESFDDKTKRLDSVQKIGTRTVLLWVNNTGTGKSHTHVAVVESVTLADIRRKVVDIQIVHSEGGRGLHQERFYKRFAVDEEGKIFFIQGEETPAISEQKRIYALPPPNDSIPRD